MCVTLTPTEETSRIVFFKSPACVYERIPHVVRQLVLLGEPIPLEDAKGMPIELSWFLDLGKDKAQTMDQWIQDNKLPVNDMDDQTCSCGSVLRQCDFANIWECTECHNAYEISGSFLYPLGKYQPRI